MSTLYVVEPGARLEKEYQRVTVVKDDVVLLRVPLAHLTDIVLVGQTGVTLPAMLALLDAGVSFSLITHTGQLRGRLTPPTPRNIPLRHQQYRRACDPDFCLRFSKAVAAAKLRNQRTLARRICRASQAADLAPESEIEAITRAIRSLEAAPDLGSLRGLEGAAGRAYFKVLRRALRSGWESPRRSRRPPQDPLNVLLSLGYTLLGQNVMTALEVVGLDPYDGFFHADKYGRPALALDLVEEFRSVIVDSVVLTVVNKRILTPQDFEHTESGVFLSQRGMRRFLVQYSARLQSQVFHPYAGKRLTYQKCLEVQARLARKFIEGEAGAYAGFLAK